MEDYAYHLTNSIADDMKKYIDSGKYSISGNFNNIKTDYENEHKGVSFERVVDSIRNGVSNGATEEFKNWSENWFWQTFGTYNIQYKFADAANEFLDEFDQQ